MSGARVVVVGAGIAGVACARALAAAGTDVEVRDRGRAIGGRMATRTVAGRPVDSGASYLTARDPRFTRVVDDWVARGIARVWTDRFHVVEHGVLGPTKDGPVRYAAPRGLRSLVAALAGDAGVPVHQESEVQTVGPGPTVDGERVDAVVLAMPDPQALRLLDPALADERALLEGRGWDPVLALLAGFPSRSWPADLDGAFVSGDAVVEWVADDGRRHGDGAAVLVAHSSAGYAQPRLADPAAATEDLLAATTRLLDISAEPDWTHVARWTYARPREPREEPFHLGPARVGLAGDGWGSPRVETAFLSGTALGEALAAELG